MVSAARALRVASALTIAQKSAIVQALNGQARSLAAWEFQPNPAGGAAPSGKARASSVKGAQEEAANGTRGSSSSAITRTSRGAAVQCGASSAVRGMARKKAALSCRPPPTRPVQPPRNGRREGGGRKGRGAAASGGGRRQARAALARGAAAWGRAGCGGKGEQKVGTVRMGRRAGGGAARRYPARRARRVRR